jgi:hypothetical protein
VLLEKLQIRRCAAPIKNKRQLYMFSKWSEETPLLPYFFYPWYVTAESRYAASQLIVQRFYHIHS